jgi:uncharacterized membrane protein HdeD (DUF308 family)
MKPLVLSILLVPFLFGVFCLLWGGLRMGQHGWEAERDPSGVSFLLLLLGCLFISIFFYPVLIAASVPLIVAVCLVMFQSFLLIIWGEIALRVALISRRRIRGEPWVIFWGVLPLVVYPPIWIGLSQLLTWLYIAGVLFVFPVGQYLLVRRWSRER